MKTNTKIAATKPTTQPDKATGELTDAERKDLYATCLKKTEATARPFNYLGQMVKAQNIFTNGSYALVINARGRLSLRHEDGQVSGANRDSVLTRFQLEPKRSDYSDTQLGAEKFALELIEFNAQWDERHSALCAKSVNEHAALLICVKNLRDAICTHNQKQDTQLNFVSGADIHQADCLLSDNKFIVESATLTAIRKDGAK